MIEHFLKHYKQVTPDICEHLDTLTSLSKECEHVTEMGFRHGASFCALLMGKPKKLITYDLVIPKEIIPIFDEIKGETEIHLYADNTLSIEIEPTDLLFIDTLHTYSQLKKELELHGDKAKKYLVFHDTETFGNKGEDGFEKGLKDALDEYMIETGKWKIFKHYPNNNGLTILERYENPLSFR